MSIKLHRKREQLKSIEMAVLCYLSFKDFKKMLRNRVILFVLLGISFWSCSKQAKDQSEVANDAGKSLVVNRAHYLDKLSGFWLGQCIANWSGLVTEMDKIGDIGEIRTGPFYTRNDWGQPDQPSIWGEGVPSELSATIDYVLIYEDSIWGADDDTDIEYMYQELLLEHKATRLSPQQIRDGWLKHIRLEEENYLWVANQKAFDLMVDGMLPPKTGHPDYNEHYRMIDAQLTTEIFGLYAPGRPEQALKMAKLPIMTVSREDAQFIAEFYVILYSLAAEINPQSPVEGQLIEKALQARQHFPERSYMAKMFDFVQDSHTQKLPWEVVRDSLYKKYQVNQEDGYDITSQELYCNGCFAAGINFGASLISLFYGKGDLQETIKIGMLCGWDADNPTATWGGLLGFIYGEKHVREVFGQNLADSFNIHRTRINFPNNGRDSFENMARKGVKIIDWVVEDDLKGQIDLETNEWLIPSNSTLKTN